MKAAEKEVEHLEREVREAAGLPTEATSGEDLTPVELPNFRVMQTQRRNARRLKVAGERKVLEDKVHEIEEQIAQVQRRLKALSNMSEDLTEDELANGAVFTNVEKENGSPIMDEAHAEQGPGAVGPGGEFVEFPAYDGSEPPLERKKAFTQFCVRTRKKVKASLDPRERSKDRVNEMLKEQWMEMSPEEKDEFYEWAQWDKQRYTHELGIFEQRGSTRNEPKGEGGEAVSIPKKSKRPDDDDVGSVPKKKRNV
jgi:HMG-box domain